MPSTAEPNRDRLAVLIAYTGEGGVEKMMNNLLRGLVEAGVAVDLLLLKGRGEHVAGIPDGVNVIDLKVRTSLQALPALARYLRRARPRALLAAKDRAGRVAVLARGLARTDTRLVLRLGMHLSGSLASKGWLAHRLRYWPVRWLYPRIDAFITVAGPVADDIAAIGRLPRERFSVIPNPTVGPELSRLIATPPDHPWLRPETEGERPPVVLGAGRFKYQKDFATLLRAFARLTERRDARLVLLGDGPDRAALLALRDELGLRDRVDFPGFQPNPAAWMAAADLFVLSSRYEGAPNVLVEALACGTPVVATDCPSGPRDILDGGRHGPLVPVGDVEAMADAMATTLDAPRPAGELRAAVADYTIPVATQRYLEVLFPH
ncbi:MAG: glycosyltransferase [Pseudomonadota bacterium]